MADTKVKNAEVTEAPEEETVDFYEQVISAIEGLPTEQAREFATKLMDGEVEGPAENDRIMENLVNAGYTPEKVAQALAVVGLRHGLRMAWWKAGQASGLGARNKERSGGSGARSRYNAAIGKAGSPGSVATATAPEVQRARKAKAEEAEVEAEAEATEELIAVHKGGGVYELSDGTSVKGKKNVPEGYKITQAA